MRAFRFENQESVRSIKIIFLSGFPKWAPNLESSLEQLSKFGELIGDSSPNWDLKIDFLESVRTWSGVSQQSVKSIWIISLSGFPKWAPNLESSLRQLSKWTWQTLGRPLTHSQLILKDLLINPDGFHTDPLWIPNDPWQTLTDPDRPWRNPDRLLTDSWPTHDGFMTDSWQIPDRFLTDSWRTPDGLLTDFSLTPDQLLTDSWWPPDRLLTDPDGLPTNPPRWTPDQPLNLNVNRLMQKLLLPLL